MNDQRAPFVSSGVVVLDGEWLNVARRAVLVADAARRRNGLPTSTAYLALAEAITAAMSAPASKTETLSSALAARGQKDIDKSALLQAIPEMEPTVTIKDAARQLGCSRRQARRLAEKLGGRKVCGNWLLDQAAIDEHRKGQK